MSEKRQSRSDLLWSIILAITFIVAFAYLVLGPTDHYAPVHDQPVSNYGTRP